MTPKKDAMGLITELESKVSAHASKDCPLFKHPDCSAVRYVKDSVDAAVITEYQDNPAFLLGVTSGILRAATFITQGETEQVVAALAAEHKEPDENGMVGLTGDEIGRGYQHLLWHLIVTAVQRYKDVTFFEDLGVMDRSFQVKVVEETATHLTCEFETGPLTGRKFRLPLQERK